MKFWEAMKALEEGKKVKRNDLHEDRFLSKDAITGTEYEIDITTEWELKNLSFAEVVLGLKEGKERWYMRKEWVGMHIQYWPPDAERNCNGGIVVFGNDMILNHVFFNCEDFEATDWIEVE